MWNSPRIIKSAQNTTDLYYADTKNKKLPRPFKGQVCPSLCNHSVSIHPLSAQEVLYLAKSVNETETNDIIVQSIHVFSFAVRHNSEAKEVKERMAIIHAVLLVRTLVSPMKVKDAVILDDPRGIAFRVEDLLSIQEQLPAVCLIMEDGTFNPDARAKIETTAAKLVSFFRQEGYNRIEPKYKDLASRIATQNRNKHSREKQLATFNMPKKGSSYQWTYLWRPILFVYNSSITKYVVNRAVVLTGLHCAKYMHNQFTIIPITSFNWVFDYTYTSDELRGYTNKELNELSRQSIQERQYTLTHPFWHNRPYDASDSYSVLTVTGFAEPNLKLSDSVNDMNKLLDEFYKLKNWSENITQSVQEVIKIARQLVSLSYRITVEDLFFNGEPKNNQHFRAVVIALAYTLYRKILDTLSELADYYSIIQEQSGDNSKNNDIDVLFQQLKECRLAYTEVFEAKVVGYLMDAQDVNFESRVGTSKKELELVVLLHYLLSPFNQVQNTTISNVTDYESV
jgi:hypothetical protein